MFNELCEICYIYYSPLATIMQKGKSATHDKRSSFESDMTGSAGRRSSGLEGETPPPGAVTRPEGHTALKLVVEQCTVVMVEDWTKASSQAAVILTDFNLNLTSDTTDPPLQGPLAQSTGRDYRGSRHLQAEMKATEFQLFRSHAAAAVGGGFSGVGKTLSDLTSSSSGLNGLESPRVAGGNDPGSSTTGVSSDSSSAKLNSNNGSSTTSGSNRTNRRIDVATEDDMAGTRASESAHRQATSPGPPPSPSPTAGQKKAPAQDRRHETVQLIEPANLSMILEHRESPLQVQTLMNVVANALDLAFSFDDLLLILKTLTLIQRTVKSAIERGGIMSLDDNGDDDDDDDDDEEEQDTTSSEEEEMDTAQVIESTESKVGAVQGQRSELSRKASSDLFSMSASSSAPETPPPAVAQDAGQQTVLGGRVIEVVEDWYGSEATGGMSKAATLHSEEEWYRSHFGIVGSEGAKGTERGPNGPSRAPLPPSASSSAASPSSPGSSSLGGGKSPAPTSRPGRKKRRRQVLSWSLQLDNGAQVEIIDDRVAANALPLFQFQVNACDVVGNYIKHGDGDTNSQGMIMHTHVPSQRLEDAAARSRKRTNTADLRLLFSVLYFNAVQSAWNLLTQYPFQVSLHVEVRCVTHTSDVPCYPNDSFVLLHPCVSLLTSVVWASNESCAACGHCHGRGGTQRSGALPDPQR